MDIGQVKTTRAFKYVILVISVSVVASVGGTAPATLTYTCDATGINSITCPLNDCSHLAIIYDDDAHRKFCKGQGAQILSSCQQAKKQMSLLVLYEEVTTEKLIGGKLPTHYKLNCIDDGNTISRNATVFSAKPVTTPQHNQNENIIHGFTLVLTKDKKPLVGNTVIHIGDKLTLQMKGSGVVIDPMSCSAYSKVNPHEKVILWEKGNLVCDNKEAAIISSKKWSHIEGDPSGISIDIFAFRFTTDAEVEIGCTALVCSIKAPTKCKQTCVEVMSPQGPTTLTKLATPTTTKPIKPSTSALGKKRKRRDIDIVGKDDSRRIRSSSVSFSVSDNEALFNSSPGLFVGNVQFLTVGVGILLFVILPKY